MKQFRLAFAASVASLLIAAPAFADCILREDTASQEIPLGPFVDSTDGNTAETGLTIANTDIKLEKSGATTQANKNSGGATHIATGDYYAVLDATDTDTVGNLRIKVHVSGALAVWLDCLVVEEAIYDAVYAASATGAHAVSTGGIAAAAFASGAIDAAAIATDAIGAAELASNAIAAAEIADGALDEATFTTTAGAFASLGVVDQGTAQAATSTTLQLRSAAAFGDDEIIGATCLVTGGSGGIGQARTITDYVSTTDTATVAAWTTTPSGTITYKCFGTAAVSGGGGGATAADVWAYSTRSLTILDEDSTTLDLNGTTIGTLATLDEDTTTLDLNATAVGSVAGAVGSVTGNLGGNVVGSVASVTGNVTGSVGSVAGSVAGNVSGSVVGSVGSVGVNGVSASSLAADAGTEIATAMLAAQGIITGTCDSGSTTTCVDDALTQADASQLEDRLICFSDGWCGLISTFAPGSDTTTFAKIAPSTRASKTYSIFPATLE